MIDRERIHELAEAYRGPAAHNKHMAKLKAHAAHLAKLEDQNDHSGYVTYLASKVLRDPQATKAAKAIEALHEYFGHLPSGLFEVRMSLSKEIWARLKKKWDFHDFHAFEVMMGRAKPMPPMSHARGKGA